MPRVQIGGNETYLSELMKRVVACEHEAVDPVRPITIQPFFVYSQGDFPYITHRLGETTQEFWAGGIYTVEKTIIGRFVVGHTSDPIPGQNEEWIYVFEPILSELFMTNVYLLSAKYKDAQPDATGDPITFRRDTGTSAFENRGLAGLPNQLGFEFSISCKYQFEINRRYNY